MLHHYKVSGMTCKACTQVVQDSIAKLAGVKKVNVDLSKAQASVEMKYPIAIHTLQKALADSLYQIYDLSDTSANKKDAIKSPDEVIEKNKTLISAYLTAVGHLDHELLQKYLHPEFKYKGAVSYHSAHNYIEMIKEHARSPIADILLKYDIKAIFTDENEGCAIYDSVSRFSGKKVSFVEWVKIADDKIVSTEVKFNRHQMKQLVQEKSKVKHSS